MTSAGPSGATKVVDRAALSEADALRLHDESVVFDGCCIMPLEDRRYVDRLIAGGVTATCYTVAMPALGGDDLSRTATKIARLLSLIENAPERLMLVTHSSHIAQAKATGRLGIVLYLQDGRPIGEDLANARALHRLGVRVIQPVYTDANLFGSGCGELTDAGLTFYGKEMVEELDRLRIMLDVSHIGDRTTDDIIRLSKAPVVATHANARALCDSARNKTDETVKALAASGGLIGVALPSGVVSKKLPTTIDRVLDHLDYLIRLVGSDHVAIGLDSIEASLEEPSRRPALSKRWHRLRPDIFGAESPDGGYFPLPEGIGSVSQVRRLTVGMAKRGHSDATIRKVLGENWIRVTGEVWGS